MGPVDVPLTEISTPPALPVRTTATFENPRSVAPACGRYSLKTVRPSAQASIQLPCFALIAIRDLPCNRGTGARGVAFTDCCCGITTGSDLLTSSGDEDAIFARMEELVELIPMIAARSVKPATTPAAVAVIFCPAVSCGCLSPINKRIAQTQG